MYVCLLDRTGKILVHTNIRHNDFNFLLKRVALYRHDLTVWAITEEKLRRKKLKRLEQSAAALGFKLISTS
jgi:hypothetical protein